MLLLAAAPAPLLPAQTIESYTFSTNRVVPDGNAAGLSDVRNVSSAISAISSLKVHLKLAGEFNGDLYAYVRHSSGFAVLLNRPGRTASDAYGYPDSGFDVTFQTGATNGDVHLYQTVAPPPGGSPLTGAWEPDGRDLDPANVTDTSARATSLTNFNNLNASGEWTLYLADMDSGGTNMLVEWGLDITSMAYPALTWASPADIVYGAALGAQQLAATATWNSTNVPGTFTYSPPAGTVLNAGSGQTLSVTFTPSDTTMFAPVSTNVTINVSKARTSIMVSSSPNPSQPGQQVSFTANVQAANGTPDGAVTILNGSRVIGSGELSAGQISFNAAALAVGAQTITANYDGSANFDASTGAASQVVNPSPILQPIPDQVANVLITLMLTNSVVDTNLVSLPLTFDVAAGSPDGVTMVDTTNGILWWQPSRDQARSTNIITVWMQDNGSPPVLATNTFTVVVNDYVELSVGRAILRTNQTGSVPINLMSSLPENMISTIGLTNLQAVLYTPQDRLGDLALTDLAPEVANATLQPQGPNTWQMQFSTAPGQVLHSTQQLAQLNFLALSNRSAFVPILVSDITDLQINGLSIWRTIGDLGGRAVVVGNEPLVEALALTNGLPNVLLYGVPGVSYEILYSPICSGTGWQPEWGGTVPTNLWMQVSGLTNSAPAMFFRALQQSGP